MASALALRSSKEYEYWLQVYARRLSSESNETKLHELCSFLLGPPYAPSNPSCSDPTEKRKSAWDPLILGSEELWLTNDLIINRKNHAIKIEGRTRQRPSEDHTVVGEVFKIISFS